MKQPLSLLSLVLLLPLNLSAVADGAVFPRVGAEARVNGNVVDINTFPIISEPFQVKKVDGEWADVGRAMIRNKDLMRPKEAVEHFSEQIEKNPKDARLWALRGAAWYYINDNEDDNESFDAYRDNAIKDLTEAIRLNPKLAEAYLVRGLVLRGSTPGRRPDPAAAIEDFTAAIRCDPKNAVAYNYRGMQLGWEAEIENQINDYTAAVNIDPDVGAYHHNRAFVLIRVGDIEGYLQDMQYFVRMYDADNEQYWYYCSELRRLAWLRATFPDASYRDGKRAVEIATKAYESAKVKQRIEAETVAAAYAEMGDFDAAVKWQQKSLELKRDQNVDPSQEQSEARLELYHAGKPYRDPGFFNTIAWTKATCRNQKYRDGKKAVELATVACELSDWKNWQYLDTLAAANAETAEFPHAIEWQQKAIALAPENMRQALTSRLTLYQSNKPCRDAVNR